MVDKQKCSRTFLLAFNLATLLAALGTLIVGCVFVFKTKDEASVGLAGLPEWAFLVGIAFSVIIFLVSILGGVGAFTRNGCVLWFYTLAMMVTIIVIIVAMVFLLLYANDKPTIESLDNAVTNAQNDLELKLVDFAETNPAEWVKTQDSFKCCGVDFEATYLFTEYNKTLPAFLESQLSGVENKCTDFHPAIIGLHAAFPTYNATAEAIALDTLNALFCKDKIRELAVESTLAAGIATGVLVLFQFISIICGFIMVCSKDAGNDQDHAKAGPVVAVADADSPPPGRPNSFF